MEYLHRREESNMKITRYDVIIVGAGPAGLSAAIEAAKNGLHPIVFDEMPDRVDSFSSRSINSLDQRSIRQRSGALRLARSC